METLHGCEDLGRGPAWPPDSDRTAHGGTPEPYGLPEPKNEGVERDRYDRTTPFRYGTRGHDPDDTVYRELDLQPAFALIGVLKRAWEYLALLKDFEYGVTAHGLGQYLRTVSPRPVLIPDDVIGRLTGVEASLDLADLKRALRFENNVGPECVILELLRRVHVNAHLEELGHCK